MTKNVEELVLDAFRVEHREQLEQIRTILASLHPGDSVADDPRVRDAFRLAHSFKGGARVCDLREAERLGHSLENVLEKLNQGKLPFTIDVISSVTMVLDSIEDWMTALEGELPLPDTSDALAAIEHMLADNDAPPTSDTGLRGRTLQLRAVFCQEYAQHSNRLGQLLALWNGSSAPAEFEDLTEAARVAHTLAGAAAVVEMRPVEFAAHQIEQLFRKLLAAEQRYNAAAQQQVAHCLNEMAAAMRQSDAGPVVAHCDVLERRNDPPGVQTSAAIEDVARSAEGTSRDAIPPSTVGHETVRVSVESLDRLMRSSSEMLSDNQHVARLTRQISALQLDVTELEREREAIRREALSTIHKLAATPEFSRVSRYLEHVDRQVSGLAKRTRHLSVEHRRVAWRLRARSAQVQRDVHEARLVPAHSVFQGFRKMVRDLAKSEHKEIEFEVTGSDVRADRMVLQDLKDPIMHVLRNCISHGIEDPRRRRAAGKPESGRVRMAIEVAGGRLNIAIEDDGRGIDVAEVRQQAIERGLVSEAIAEHQSADEILSLVFAPGFSTVDHVTELAGRGMGLSIVHESVTRLQGQVKLSPQSQGGVRLSISVPISVSTHRILLVACGEQTIAIPTQGVERLLRVPKDKIESVEGQPVVTYERRPIRLVRLCELLGLPETSGNDSQQKMMSVVLLKSGARLIAVAVDAFLEERESLILHFDEFAATSHWAGGILLDDGRVALVVQPTELLENAGCRRNGNTPALPVAAEQPRPAKVLIVDDSFTTRTLEKSILESHGFDVSVATDGVEALSQLRQQKYGLVISDVEMPRMDGFALLEQMKADPRLAAVPVILVTSRDRPEDQQHGLDLGANAYIVKRKFDHQELLNVIRQLL